jgi:hypothetical protein
VLPPHAFPKAHKLLAIFLAFCRLAHPEVAERRVQDGRKPRLATAAFCLRFCPGLAPFMQCFREGNVVGFRELQQRHAESLWRLGLTVSFPVFFAVEFCLRPCCSAPLLFLMSSKLTTRSNAVWQVLVASLEPLVIRRLIICYIAVYFDATSQLPPTLSKRLHSVKHMLQSPVLRSRWNDSLDAQMQSVIMMFSSKLLKANLYPNDQDPSDLTLVFSPSSTWPKVASARGRKK